MILFHVFVIFLSASLCRSLTRMDIENVHSMLFVNSVDPYLADIRPRPTTVIKAALQLLSIGGLDEISGTFSTLVSLRLSWHDDRLMWSTTFPGPVQNITVKQKKIWTPTIMVRHPVKKRTKFGFDDNLAVVCETGQVILTIDDYLETVCNFDVTHFPFDKQTCDIEFIPWIYESSAVDFQQIHSDVDMKFYSENGMWEMLGSEASVVHYTKHPSTFAALKYSIKLKRQPGYFILSIFVPVVMLMLLNSVVFILPTDSGERVGYAITCLLALAVFLTLTSDVLPKTSNPLSILACFLMLLVLVSALICLLTIISLWLCHKDDKTHMPIILKKFTYFMQCRNRKIRAKSGDTNIVVVNSSTEKSDSGNINTIEDGRMRVSMKSTKRQITTLKSFEKQPIEMETKEDKYSDIGWKQFSEVFDTVGFILTISVTGTLGFLYVTIAGGNL